MLGSIYSALITCLNNPQSWGFCKFLASAIFKGTRRLWWMSPTCYIVYNMAVVWNKRKLLIFISRDTCVVRIKPLSDIWTCDLSKLPLAVCVWLSFLCFLSFPVTHWAGCGSFWLVHSSQLWIYRCSAGVFLVLLWDLPYLCSLLFHSSAWSS